MKRQFAGFAVVAVAAVVFTGVARADDFTFNYSSISVCGSGTLSGELNGDGSLSIVSGHLDVTSSAAAGGYDLMPNSNGRAAILSPSGFFIIDNQLFPSHDAKLSWYGLLFGNGSTEVNIWGNGDGNPYTFYAHGAHDVSDNGSFSLSSVPAPGGMALMTLGGVTLGMRRRRV